MVKIPHKHHIEDDVKDTANRGVQVVGDGVAAVNRLTIEAQNISNNLHHMISGATDVASAGVTQLGRLNDNASSFVAAAQCEMGRATAELQHFNNNHDQSNEIARHMVQDIDRILDKIEHFNLEAQLPLQEVRRLLVGAATVVKSSTGAVATSITRAGGAVGVGIATGQIAGQAIKSCVARAEQKERQSFETTARLEALEGARLENGERARARRDRDTQKDRSTVLPRIDDWSDFTVSENARIKAGDRVLVLLLVLADDTATISQIRRYVRDYIKPAMPRNAIFHLIVGSIATVQLWMDAAEAFLQAEVGNCLVEKPFRDVIFDAFITSSHEQTMSGSAYIQLDRIGPLSSRYMTLHTGFTGNVARHILPSSLIFSQWTSVVDARGANAIVGENVRPLDCFIGSADASNLKRMFPDANFMTTAEAFRKWRPLCADRPLGTITGGTGLCTLVQGGLVYIKGVGIIKLTTGVCVAVLPGALVAAGAGALASGVVYAACSYGKDTVYLFNCSGPLNHITSDHRAQLRKLYNWQVNDAVLEAGKIKLK